MDVIPNLFELRAQLAADGSDDAPRTKRHHAEPPSGSRPRRPQLQGMRASGRRLTAVALTITVCVLAAAGVTFVQQHRVATALDDDPFFHPL